MSDFTNHTRTMIDAINELRGFHMRVLVGIAGAPGSGKSTLANEVAHRLRMDHCACAVVNMDGFHLDNALLDDRGLLGRKGAPETFDVDGFLNMVTRLGTARDVITPIFDRQRDIAVAGAAVVPADCPVVLVEGNYLLFNERPWSQLAELWDLSIFMDVPMEDLRARLIHRWLSHNLSRAAATKRAESNDIPNAQRVIEKMLPAHLILRTEHAT